MKRRHFLAGLTATAISLPARSLFARGPIERSGPPRFQVGLAAYSLRQYFEFSRGKQQKPPTDGKTIDMVGFLDYCVAQGFESAELTSYFFPPEIDDSYLLNVKHAAFMKGVTISGTAIGNNFTIGKGPKLEAEIVAAKKWIDNAAVLGAPHIRFFAGTGRELDKEPERIDEAIEALAQCADYAAARGVVLGVENHGNLTADHMLQIMSRVDNPWVGINLDSGNFISDDPYADLVACVPYAVNVQIKVSMKSPDGKKYPADMNRIAGILKDAGYQGFVILEYEDEDPYENIPRAHEALRQALGV